MPIAFAKLIAGLDITSPFVGAWELERRRGRPYKARLGANECLFGASPAAMAVLTARGPETALYCDPTHTELRDAIALAFGLSRRHVVVAEGIEGLLGLFTRALLNPGDVAVTSQGGYPSFDFYVRGCGGKLVHIPYLSSGKNDLEGLIDAARRHRAKRTSSFPKTKSGRASCGFGRFQRSMASPARAWAMRWPIRRFWGRSSEFDSISR
ncbi:MAG: aminotransferase class I/II-fold pyridoxal phosphate-dependent enzyme [Polyangiaceae bacterium]|nr:aminotransferase class I/II-fold pyridoxal phosphate-dependent enzyme [Polyangiaceae bacterium]